MAVPKKRTGSSAQGHRRSNWKANKPEVTKCTTCNETVLAHTVCTACGNYKGQPVRLKDRTEEFVAKQPTAKPAKTENAVEAKAEVVEETVVEEVTAEAVETVETEVVEEETTDKE